MKQHLDNLLQEASEDDCTHDVVFQVTVFINLLAPEFYI